MRFDVLGYVLLAGLGTSAALLSATAMSQSTANSPVRYAMDAATMSGMGAMAGGGGGLGAMMGMMAGGPPEAARLLTLHHGAGTAFPKPLADHFMPKGAGLGASVRLVPPIRVQAEGEASFQRPSGRLLLYWGCGANTPKGQPVVIDFSKIAQGGVPPGLFMSGLDMPEDWQVTAANSRTYTYWPNGKDNKAVPVKGSLVGAHRIAANYAKEISFTLGEDFMPPLQARTSDAPGGGTRLAWNGLDKATGYYAWAIAAKDTGRGGAPTEMVWWASSKEKAFGGALWDWISPAGVRRLITAGTVMPPQQRDCTIPAEVVKASGEAMMVNLQAYGPQVDFAYPPRPANTRTAWNPDWIARVRFRSSTMLIPGMDEMGDGTDRADTGESAAGQNAKPSKPKCKGLKGIAQRAAGLCE